MSVDRTLNIELQDYDVKEIADGVYKINEFNLSTMFIIKGSESALVVDCGTGVGDYLEVVRKIIGDMPYKFVATHAHVDHIGGREQFGALRLSEADKPIIKDVTVFYRYFYIAVMKYLMFFKNLPWKKVNIKKVAKENQTIFLKEGDIFDLGGKTVEVFETPGHTLGSLSFLVKEDRLILTGDVINPNNLMFLKHATTIETLNKTLKKIAAIDGYDTIWASHLSEPIPKEVFENGIKCTEKILKSRNTLLPFIWFTSYDGYVIIHLRNKIHNK